MLVPELDDVTYDLEVDGELVRRTLQRRVWERRGWATVALVYEERDPAGAWKPAKLALIRLQRARGAWKKHAAISLAGAEAIELCDALAGWRGALAGGSAEGAEAAEGADGADDE